MAECDGRCICPDCVTARTRIGGMLLVVVGVLILAGAAFVGLFWAVGVWLL
jgi:hypothetical protein